MKGVGHLQKKGVVNKEPNGHFKGPLYGILFPASVPRPLSHPVGHKNYLGQIVIKPFCRQTSQTNALSLEAFILLHGRFGRQCPINTSEMANFLLLRTRSDKIYASDSAVFCIRSREAAIPIPIEGEQAAAQKNIPGTSHNGNRCGAGPVAGV